MKALIVGVLLLAGIGCWALTIPILLRYGLRAAGKNIPIGAGLVLAGLVAGALPASGAVFVLLGVAAIVCRRQVSAVARGVGNVIGVIHATNVVGTIPDEDRGLAKQLRNRRRMAQLVEDCGLTRRQGDAVLAPAVHTIEPHRVGVLATIELAPGQTPDDIAAAEDALAHGLGVEHVEVLDLPGAVPGTAEVLIHTRPDATADVQEYPGIANITAYQVPLGVDLYGNPVAVNLLENSVLIGGLPGSGKSGALNALLAGVSQLPHVALHGIDPKRVELSLWRSRFDEVVWNSDEMTSLLTELVGEMESRYDVFQQRGIKKITPQLMTEFPLHVTVIDELAEVIGSAVTREEKKAAEERAVLIQRLLQLGRAVGMVVWAATQKPDSSNVPTAIRDLFSQRIAMRTLAVEMTKVIMGAWSPAAPAHELRGGKGVGYLGADHLENPVKMRSYWVPDEECEPRAQATAHLRVGESARHG
ncbi:FtsK/SpoIIIE domain-containing protein [Flexivirga meconopsidis]|uniref:FtsK/SpoIIIE domain-containing protein n=1 Tax=Flexivirga meconopsidis TaxID=2977121 RepID=UPI00224011E3|nr:FtsK/SpoIIIE domain-containing protein [Flexivirga meconopsidis]